MSSLPAIRPEAVSVRSLPGEAADITEAVEDTKAEGKQAKELVRHNRGKRSFFKPCRKGLSKPLIK